MLGKIFLQLVIVFYILVAIYTGYLTLPGQNKKFKIGDRVRIKSRGALVSQKHPRPDVWVIDDIYKTMGYKIFKEGTCITTIQLLYDRDLEPATDAPRNDIDVFINDTLKQTHSQGA